MDEHASVLKSLSAKRARLIAERDKVVQQFNSQIAKIEVAMEVVSEEVAEPQAASSPSILGLLGNTGAQVPAYGIRPPSVEALIIAALSAEDGVSSEPIIERVQKQSDAKEASISSSLSRLVSKGIVRRDGRKYFLARKGETLDQANGISHGEGLSVQQIPLRGGSL